MPQTSIRFLQLDGMTVELVYPTDAPSLQELLTCYISNISPLPGDAQSDTIDV